MAQWQNGLCSCFSDCKACCITYWCPCITYGKTYATQGEDYMKCCCFFFWTVELGLCCWTVYQMAVLREKIRQSKGIEGSFMNDCCMSYWCSFCVLVQTAREVNALDGGVMDRQ